MGKFKPFNVGEYRLGSLGDDACAVWEEGRKRRRFRLGTALGQDEAEAALHAFAKQRTRIMEHRGTVTCQVVYEKYITDRKLDGKKTRQQEATWKQLRGMFGEMLPGDIDKGTYRAYE